MDERRQRDMRSLTFHDADRSICLTFKGGHDERREGTLLDAAEWARDEGLTVMEVSPHTVRWERVG